MKKKKERVCNILNKQYKNDEEYRKNPKEYQKLYILKKI